MTCVAFVLVSWRPSAPAGMERAVAAAAAGLVQSGQQAVIVTADPTAPVTYAGAPVVVLDSLCIPDPCTDHTLRAAVDAEAGQVQVELEQTFTRHHVDSAVYVDGLWGLGRIMPTTGTARRVLAAHVVGHQMDMTAALARAELVIVPSPVVIGQALAAGYDTAGWQVVPNTLLVEPRPPSPILRRWLRQYGTVRVMARLGADKGVRPLLAAARERPAHRVVEVALAQAGFETSPGSQRRLLEVCRALAALSRTIVCAGLAWEQAPDWLAHAAAVVVPSEAESFGLVALEAMAGGTPVVCFDIGNLPELVGPGGVIVSRRQGHAGLWRAVEKLLVDPVGYEQTSRAGYYRARDYRPAHVADLLVKVVS